MNSEPLRLNEKFMNNSQREISERAISIRHLLLFFSYCIVLYLMILTKLQGFKN